MFVTWISVGFLLIAAGLAVRAGLEHNKRPEAERHGVHPFVVGLLLLVMVGYAIQLGYAREKRDRLDCDNPSATKQPNGDIRVDITCNKKVLRLNLKEQAT